MKKQGKERKNLLHSQLRREILNTKHMFKMAAKYYRFEQIDNIFYGN